MARTMHLAWKERLQRYLEGKRWIDEGELVSHRECDLGKWLYNEGMKKFGGLAEMRILESEHANMHAQVRLVVSLLREGDRHAAEEEYRMVKVMSDRLVALLREVERRANEP